MKKYFYAEGNSQLGPYTVAELIQLNIKRDTLVWSEEMTSWQPASNVSDFAEYFAKTPPPINANMQTPPPFNMSNGPLDNSYANQAMPKNWLVESILVTLFCCLPFGVVGIVYASGVESKWRSGYYREAQEASENAGKWTKIGFYISLAGIALYILFVIVLGVAVGTSRI